MPAGKLEIKIFDDYTVTFTPMYCDGYISKLDKTDYKLSCYCVEGKSVKTPSVIKEWILNGSKSGLRFCENSRFESGVRTYSSILQVLCKYKIVQKNLFKWTELNSVRFYVIRKISTCQ